MSSALLFVKGNKLLGLDDYINKIKGLLSNYDKYSNIYVVITDTQFKEYDIVNDNDELMMNNIQTLINLGFDKNVKFIQESRIKNIFINSNVLAKYVFLSKLIKSSYLKNDIYEQNENNIKASSILGILTMITEMVMFGDCDMYGDYGSKYLLEVAKKIVDKYNSIHGKKLKVPNLIVNREIMKNMVGLDGNVNVSNKFNNDCPLLSSKEEMKLKIMSIYTDPNHIKVEDKGSIVDNPLFMFVDQLCESKDVKKFFEFDGLEALKVNYEKGGVADSKVKEMLYHSVLNKFAVCKEKIERDIIVKRLYEDTYQIDNLFNNINY